jgi:hypothetical protein
MVKLTAIATLFLVLFALPVFASNLEQLCTVKSAKNYSNEELISKIQSMLQCQNGIGATLQETRNMPFYASVPESLNVLSGEYQSRISSGQLNPKNHEVADAKGILEGVKKDVARLGTSGAPSKSSSDTSPTQDGKADGPKIWTPSSFEQSCKSGGGTTQKKTSSDRVQLECKKNGNEIRSAWFDNKNLQMMGSLERVRSENNQITKDVEYDSSGKVKDTYLYVQSSSDDKSQSKNVFVFDKDKNVERGNILIGKENYVVANPKVVFHNGQPSSLTELQDALAKEYQAPASNSLYDQVLQIWNKQSAKYPGAGSTSKPGTK